MIVGLAFLYFYCFCGILLFKYDFRKRIFFAGMFFILIGMGLTVFAALFEKNRTSNKKPAIVFADTVSMKNEPKILSPDTFILHEGTKVYILESIASWKKIQLTDETTGWIQSESIKELN